MRFFWCKHIIVVFLLALAVPAFGMEWYESYQKGQEVIKKENCTDGKALMLDAVRKHPGDDLKARSYGTFTMEYVPDFYLAQCAVQEGDFKAAEQYLQKAEQGG